MNIADPSVQSLANLNWLQIFLFGVYPYVALTIAIIGTWVRFDLSQYSWKTGSTQMLRSKNMRLASNLFHVGIIVVLLGHLFGMLTPHFLYDRFISAGHKQILAVVVGGIAGVFCWFGLVMLMWRRFTDDRISNTSSFSDKLVLVLLFIQLNLGLLSIFTSVKHLDGYTMMNLAGWAQDITILRPLQAAARIEQTDLIYQLHMALGITLIAIFPFTRLIHIISAPIWYFGRRYQIVRQKNSQ
ncbi:MULTISPECIES: respiratory nitrate reductase subunit gamma [Psychrobacter]|jgi:nitrate reductase gamma subunit|uniref:nitrate reductase (quinone) n=1 Tax=Psychrobacter immobilis TaxID=498 RepID=A0A2V2A011_PSYIM|nr:MULTISPECIES: respiratory nitrate reductase subunit gamma [Psychrobacter]KRG32015.1 nitrate reductase [Psychrobacter sp. P11F6]MCG3810199.1 respiratory nitrate reductase subunit gamma [Psychrobacter sp. Ps4]MCG3872547.1 respiratory nitrate reductase subunit gamma [Psychrobacter sp. Ps7]PWK15228.1 respiratory nitrate reductase gamma subunit [Psychrobacter immobilis]WLG13062.1 respiratory nitrate reductase subunit gamma [Psychrobacter cibarius]